ncbi:MAG: hypothetical protein MPJ50_19195, partial [Pirellulales bacterium]|nr:hypothetical protein [Pirellulales bacterium]
VELVGNHGLLALDFEKYINALVESGSNRSDSIIRVYGCFLQLAVESDQSIRDEVFDSFSALGGNFDAYVDALISRGRSKEVLELIALLAPHWDHNLGYCKLGSAAFRAGDIKVAEPFLVKLWNGIEGSSFSAEMSMLAEIWYNRDKQNAASDLLIDCLRKTVAEIQETKFISDRQMLADQFHLHRSTYLRLFPDGESDLTEQGLLDGPC